MKKPIYLAGQRQNCYILGMDKKEQSTSTVESLKKQVTLETVKTSNGYYEELRESDYPITSESVSSYMDSADYRNDPAQAIAGAPKRVNLGDVSQVQEFLKGDTANAVRVLRSVTKALESFSKTQGANKEQQEKGVVENNG